MQSLSSFDNTVFSLKCTQQLFSSKYLFEEPNIDSNFHSSRKAEHSRFPVLSQIFEGFRTL